MTDAEQPAIISAEQVAREGRPRYVGHLDELRAIVARIHKNAELKRPLSVLVFGPPGTGKSSFAQVLAYELGRSGMPFGVLPIRCARYAAWYRPTETREHLEDLRAKKIQSATSPLICVLDEVDSVAGDRPDFPSGSTVVHWTLDLIRWSNEQPGMRIMMGICNYPRAMDRALLTEFDCMIYLEPPTDEQAAQILALAGVKDAGDVIRDYNQLFRESGAEYTSRSVAKAIEAVKLLFSDEWELYSPEEMANALHAQNRVVPSETKSEYERTNLWVLSPGRAFVRSMLPRFRRLLEEGKVQEVVDPIVEDKVKQYTHGAS